MSKKNFLFLGIFVVLVIFLPGYSRLQKLKEKNRLLNSEIERLSEENQEFAHQIERLETDPFYIEKKARDKMGIGKRGEVRYRIIYESEEKDVKDKDSNR
jgi:cell division protein FtsB